MRLRRLGMLTAVLTTACFEQAKPVEPTAGMDGTATEPLTTEGDVTTAPGPDTADPPATTGTTTQTAADDTLTDGDTTTGEPLPIQCGDGMPAPGELCFDETTVIMANDATYSARIGSVSGTPATDVVHLIPDQVVVRAGDGEGSFGLAVFDASVVAERLELADFDGDGLLDMVVPETAGALRLLLGSRSGSFSPVAQVTIGSDPRALVVGDLDGDGSPDAVVSTGDQTLHVVLGDGAGGLAPVGPVELTDTAVGLGLADFDEDGALDLALAYSSAVALRRGMGDGTLPSEVAVSATEGPTALVAGDFDGDGHADVAYVTALGSLRVLRGDGTGGFAPDQATPTGILPTVVHAVELDGSGGLELVVAHQGETTVHVYTVAADRGPVRALELPLAAAASALASGDVNGDGVPDLAATPTGASIVTVLLSTP